MKKLIIIIIIIIGMSMMTLQAQAHAQTQSPKELKQAYMRVKNFRMKYLGYVIRNPLAKNLAKKKYPKLAMAIETSIALANDELASILDACAVINHDVHSYYYTLPHLQQNYMYQKFASIKLMVATDINCMQYDNGLQYIDIF